MPDRTMRPFTFLADARDPMPGRDLAELARRAESMGFHALVIPDHLIAAAVASPGDGDDRGRDRPRCGSAPFVFNNDLRHPAVLAQDLASLDVLSRRSAGHRDRGRLEPARVRRDRPAVRPGRRSRVARLAEAIAVLKGCFADGPVQLLRRALHDHRLRRRSEAGPAAAPAVPDRRRRPADPDAGRARGGHRRARAADPRPSSGRDPRSLTFAATAEKIGWVREAAGDRFDDARASTSTRRPWPVTVTDDARAEARARHRPPAGRGPACELDRGRGARVAAPVHRLDRRLRREVRVAARAARDHARSWSATSTTLAPVVERLAGT